MNCARLFLILCLLPITALSQQAGPSPADAQRAAMHKLNFLVGHWSGPVTVIRGPGEPLRLLQTETVDLKLDGLVMLIEGKSTAADGTVQFSALATVTYDDTSGDYHIRAYNDGHYVDTALLVPANGFAWSFAAGPAHISNAMHLTPTGEWAETTDVTFGDNPPFRSVDMLLRHLP